MILALQFVYQVDRLRWFEARLGSLWVVQIVLSSAYSATEVFGVVGWSAEKNRTGYSIAP
jgi:hypothetical protein